MPELRRNPLTDAWVIIAPERKYRPSDQDCRSHREPARCPFCPGNEELTPPAIHTAGSDGSDAWQVRVIPNRYPALRVEEPAEPRVEGVHAGRPGVGAHEVIIDSPEHEPLLRRDACESMHARSLAAAQARMLDLRGDARLAYHMYFRNSGPDAGSTLSHPHAQLLAMPVVPPSVVAEISRSEAHQASTGESLLASMVAQERRDAVRIIATDGSAIAFCPWASAVPFEVWVVDEAASSPFMFADQAVVARVGRLVGAAMWALERAVPSVGAHVSLHVRPAHQPGRLWDWHVRIRPTLAVAGGAESAFGVFLNTEDPDDAAEFMRRILEDRAD